MVPSNRSRHSFHRPPPTLYKSQEDMKKALFATIDLLQEKIPEQISLLDYLLEFISSSSHLEAAFSFQFSVFRFFDFSDK